MPLTVEHIKPFPANSNPFHHEPVMMGIEVDNNLLVMCESHRDNRFIEVVYRPTGERLRITVPGATKQDKPPVRMTYLSELAANPRLGA